MGKERMMHAFFEPCPVEYLAGFFIVSGSLTSRTLCYMIVPAGGGGMRSPSSKRDVKYIPTIMHMIPRIMM
jgi:hypothetical protein